MCYLALPLMSQRAHDTCVIVLWKQQGLALFPGLLHLQFLIACSILQVIKTGGVEGLEMRLARILWNELAIKYNCWNGQQLLYYAAKHFKLSMVGTL